MSSTIAEAHTFFTNREGLLESLSLAAVRQTDPGANWLPLAPDEEVHLQLGSQPDKRWSLWLTQRMRTYLKARQVNLLYVDAGAQPHMRWLYNVNAQASSPSPAMLAQLRAAGLRAKSPREVWLADLDAHRSRLFIFLRLDERDPDSGWLGLEIDSHAVSSSLKDTSAGEFMMFNADGMLVFTNSPGPTLVGSLRHPMDNNFFGFAGQGLLPEHLVISKPLMSSDWQLVYAIDLSAILAGLWQQLLALLHPHRRTHPRAGGKRNVQP
ncbi:hypothetical protein G6F24_014217 [Rhizopus arrhizus]|nr:hypothetical protein G6F24_014217 [Rhizopus arrhizus]